MRKSYLAIIICVFVLVIFIGCAKQLRAGEGITDESITLTVNESYILYKNTQYGFSFSLPVGWKDYKIVNKNWEGLAIGGQEGKNVVETGPIISIRHPQWTTESPRQDIPIMVFTLNQWNLLQQEKFHIGAAPIGPRELGRNSRYVFALPARYNFAFPKGYEEVESILNGNPLQAAEED